MLSRLLAQKHFPTLAEKESAKQLAKFELKMLRIQQGIWHSKSRAIIVFEGPDAAGKGGAIRYLTKALDPRGVRVHSAGPPNKTDQGKHYLYRFWKALPAPGTVAIFDRSWYGRVLVERVKKLTPRERWKEAYQEINHFEKMLAHDGIDLVKIYLAIHPGEQLKRFEARLGDPYKQWKLSEDDIEAHREWDEYVQAADDMFKKTDGKITPWNLIPGDSKDYARVEVLKTVTKALSHHGEWIESAAAKLEHKEREAMLKQLESQFKK